MKVNIFQPDIRNYRVPLFESLANEYGWICNVIHGGTINKTNESVTYNHIRCPSIKILGMNLQLGIKKIIENADVNIIGFDFHWPNPMIYALLKSRLPVIYWGHGIGRSKLAAYLKTKLIKRAGGIILYGYRGRDKLIDLGVNKNKIFVAPNTIFVPNHSDCSNCKKDFFLFVGRLQLRKKIDVLIDAYVIYKKRNGKKKLIIVGDGSILESLKKQANKSGFLKSIIFLPGTMDNIKLKKIYSNAIAYVSPGHVGLGVVHAFSYGVPVLTMYSRYHAPEFEYMKNNFNGIISAPTVDDYAAALLKIDENCNSSIMGKNGYKTYIENANPQKMLSGFKTAVDYITKKRK